jgi:hypothetical protein
VGLEFYWGKNIWQIFGRKIDCFLTDDIVTLYTVWNEDKMQSRVHLGSCGAVPMVMVICGEQGGVGVLSGVAVFAQLLFTFEMGGTLPGILLCVCLQ